MVSCTNIQSSLSIHCPQVITHMIFFLRTNPGQMKPIHPITLPIYLLKSTSRVATTVVLTWHMRSSRSLIPILMHDPMSRSRTSSGRRTILHIRRFLSPNSRALSRIAMSHISGRSMGRQRIRLLPKLSITRLLWLALPETTFG